MTTAENAVAVETAVGIRDKGEALESVLDDLETKELRSLVTYLAAEVRGLVRAFALNEGADDAEALADYLRQSGSRAAWEASR